MRIIVLVVAAMLPLVSSLTYIHSILAGKTQPHRMTRLLLLVITGVSCGALLANGDTSGVWLALTSFTQALVIWVLALKRGIGGSARLDIICLAVCVLGVGWWLLSGQSLAGLIASIVADFVAIIPSLLKTIRLPYTESMQFYALDALAAALILTIGPYTSQAILYPCYLLLVNLVFVAAIQSGRRRGIIDV